MTVYAVNNMNIGNEVNAHSDGTGYIVSVPRLGFISFFETLEEVLEDLCWHKYVHCVLVAEDALVRIGKDILEKLSGTKETT